MPPEVLEHFPTLLITSHGKVWTGSQAALDWYGGNGFATCVNNYTHLPQLQPILKEIESYSERLTYDERIELCAVTFGIKSGGVSHSQFTDCRNRGGTVDMCIHPKETMPEVCPATESEELESELVPEEDLDLS